MITCQTGAGVIAGTQMAKYNSMRCYIVATGSSLQGFDFSGLKKYDCIAVNAGFRLVPWFKHLVAIDQEFYLMYFSSLKRHIGKLHAVKDYSNHPIMDRLKVRLWESVKVNGVDKFPLVCHGYNSTYTAIGIAMNLGYTDIRLLGFDAGLTYVDGLPVEWPYFDHLIAKCKILKKNYPHILRLRIILLIQM